MVLVTLLFGFLAGALTTIVVEFVALVLVIRRLNRRVQKEAEERSAPGISQLHDDSFLPSSYYNKEVSCIHISSSPFGLIPSANSFQRVLVLVPASWF